jgi:hypothetical protein
MGQRRLAQPIAGKQREEEGAVEILSQQKKLGIK